MKKNPKKKQTILIFLLVILISLTIILTIIYFYFSKQKKFNINQPHENKLEDSFKESLKDEQQGSFHLINKKEISICKDLNHCDYLRKYIPEIKTDINNSELQSILEAINTKNNEYYQKYNDSTLTDEVCNNVKDKYNHRYYPKIAITLYEKNDIISIAVDRELIDVCTKDFKGAPTEVYLYQTKEKRILTPHELMTSLNLTEEKIIEIINTYIENLSKTNQISLSMDDVRKENNKIQYTIYYTNDGSLWVSFEVKDLEGKYVTLSEIISS